MDDRPQALLVDVTRCSGCRSCVTACRRKQGFPEDGPGGLHAESYTEILADADDNFVRNLCRHCVHPSCASVCPVGALEKTARGPVVYDASRCIGCRYCMTACPFNIPRYEWDEPVPSVRKCDLCADRLEKGEPTACAAACPNEATVSGSRTELLAEAHRRIEEDPDLYFPRVFGEEAVGGTSVLFLAPSDLSEVLGFREALGTEPLPRLTWDVLRRIPGFVVTGGAALLALHWIVGRRNRLAGGADAAAAGRGEEDRRDR